MSRKFPVRAATHKNLLQYLIIVIFSRSIQYFVSIYVLANLSGYMILFKVLRAAGSTPTSMLPWLPMPCLDGV